MRTQELEHTNAARVGLPPSAEQLAKRSAREVLVFLETEEQRLAKDVERLSAALDRTRVAIERQTVVVALQTE